MRCLFLLEISITLVPTLVAWLSYGEARISKDELISGTKIARRTKQRANCVQLQAAGEARISKDELIPGTKIARRTKQRANCVQLQAAGGDPYGT